YRLRDLGGIREASATWLPKQLPDRYFGQPEVDAEGGIWGVSVSLIMRTGGANRPLPRDHPRVTRSDHDGAFIIALFQQPLSAVSPAPLGCSATDGWACICRWASWEFIGLPGLAPSACCAAVGWPCIWRCVSCDDAATSPIARFIVSVDLDRNGSGDSDCVDG